MTSGDDLVIENAAQFPYFEVASSGKYTIHTLVFDPNTLDLSIIEFGTTTGVDVNSLLVQGGGDICAALDVAGQQFEVSDCSHRNSGIDNSTLFPNPGKDLIRLSFGAASFEGAVKVEVTDLNGAVLKTQKFAAATTTTELNVAGIAKGMYIVSIQYANETEELIRFVKQ